MAKEIYEKARYKPAECLAQGKHFSINGGNYQICPRQGTCLGQICRKAKILSEKGRYITRIEVTYQNREIFQHFGHTEQFKVYGIEAGKISSSQIVASDGLGHGALAGFPLCNGMMYGFVVVSEAVHKPLLQCRNQLCEGISSSGDDAVHSLPDGKLYYNPNIICNHHNHEEGHSCGSHGYGNQGRH